MANADRLIDLFNEAKARPVGAERERFLAEACPDDSELKAQVVSLLQAHEGAGDFLKNTLALASSASSPSTIRYFGDYELLEEIARGGMGVVFKARQVTLNRTVALKMILAGQLASASDVRRFRTEAEAAANLQHPNIVAIHEVGEHQGQQYFSMDYIEGRDLAKLVRENPLPAARAARYVQITAEAIHYAHGKGVLHRDLKPSNVLIDSADQPRVTDFGLAKRLDSQPSTLSPQLTLTGQVLGTPNYMPPEQAEGKIGQVGPAGDVYGLGAILYHLITGRAPFVAETVHETLSQVLTAEPASPRLLNPSVPRDLETIALRCLEKEPARRYRSAEELADDLGRFMRHEPIHARPITPGERAVKWVKRHPAVASLTALVLLTGAVGVGGVVWQWRHAVAAQQMAQQRADSEAYEAYAAKIPLALGKIGNGAFGRATAALDSCPTHLRHWEWGWLKQVCLAGPKTLEGHSRPINCAAFSPDGRHAITGDDDGIATLWKLDQGTQITLVSNLVSSSSKVKAVAFSDGGQEALTLDSGTVKFWDANTGRLLQTFRPAEYIEFASLSLNRVLTTAGTNHPNERRIWDTRSARETARLVVTGETVQFKAFSPDGKRALAEVQSAALNKATPNTSRWEVLSAETGGTICSLPLSGFGGNTAFSFDGSKLFTLMGQTAKNAKNARIWDTDTGREISVLGISGYQSSSSFHAWFSPNAERLVTTRTISLTRAEGIRAEVWEVSSGRLVASFGGHTDVIETGAFSPDGRRVVTAARGEAKVWSAETGEEMKDLGGQRGDITCVALSPDGQQVVTGGQDTVARVWDLRANDPIVFLSNCPPRCFSAAFSPNGRFAMTVEVADSDSTGKTAAKARVKVWEAGTGREVVTLEQSDLVLGAVFSPDSSRLVTVATGEELSQQRHARVWQIEGGRDLRSFAADLVSPSSDGTKVFGLNADWIANAGKRGPSVTNDETVKIWDAASGVQLATHVTNGNVQFTADEQHLIGTFYQPGSTGHGGHYATSVFDPETMKAVGQLSNQVLTGSDIWVLPGRKRVIVKFRDLTSLSGERPIQLHELQTGKEIARLRIRPKADTRFTWMLRAQTASADQTRFILERGDNVAWVFETESGRQLAELVGHSGIIRSLALFPDGRRVLTGSEDHTAKLWDAQTGRELLSLPHPDTVSAVAIAPDGQRILTVCQNGTAMIWSAGHWKVTPELVPKQSNRRD